jgi:hypothetical protein
MMYNGANGLPPPIDEGVLGAFTSGYMLRVKSRTRSVTHDGRLDSDSWISFLRAVFIALPTSFPIIRRSMVKAEISTTCSVSGWSRVEGAVEPVGGADVDFPKREVNVFERREDACVVDVREFGRGGSGGLLKPAGRGGRGRAGT